ncbi:MAG: D-glycero-beta-D-manno-heptose-7-phosphate kinase [Zetaproteobacteria bacterium]|nr:MAG: D-glycero-beta-D-manno-heptose-7-phosphate kinase [Zetaproteobacteria bacterium]
MDCAMVGVVGDDEPGRWACQRLEELGADASGVITKRNGRPTPVKTRVIARHQQVVRIDHEWTEPVRPETHAHHRIVLEALLPQARAVILSDYGKGMLTPAFIEDIIRSARKIPVFVDPFPPHARAYRGAFAATPNLAEAAAMTGLAAKNDDAHAEQLAHALFDQLNLGMALITRAERGMTLFDGNSLHHIPTEAREVFDVTGAGDTVIAVLAAAIAEKGLPPLEAARLANKAAGIVVGKVGAATATWEEIARA